MSKFSRVTLVAALMVTAGAIVTWQATGGDWYTKYEVIDQIESKPDPNDPLVAAGFYDGEGANQTIVREEFRLGLLPTATGVFDKHALSVASVVGPTWALVLGILWQKHRRRQRSF